MSRRRTQYQRRQDKRETDQIMSLSFLITLGLSGVVYVLMREQIFDVLYPQMLASNGTLSYEQALWNYVGDHWSTILVAFFVTYTIIAVLLAVKMRRKPATFDFGDPNAEPDLDTMHHQDFEHAVAELIRRQGYQTRIVGGAGDGGVDIEVYNNQRKMVGAVQCKRYDSAHALSPKHVREMIGVKHMLGIEFVYLATTTYFTEATRREAKKYGVRLIDGNDLYHMTKAAKRVEQKKVAQSSQPQDSHAMFRPPRDMWKDQ